MKKLNATAATPRLSEDVIMVILSMLPVKSVLRFRCVCKRWLELCKNPNFTKMHLNHANASNKFNILLNPSCHGNEESSYYLVDIDASSSSSLTHNYKAIKFDFPCSSNKTTFDAFIGSCNGIVCVSFHSDSIREDAICMWNPSTQEYKKIPKPPIHDENPIYFSYGFGYDQKIDDYKLLLLLSYTVYGLDSEVWVYTLGLNSWKQNANVPYNLYGLSVSKKLLNGAIHCVVINNVAVTDRKRKRQDTDIIISFDVAEEVTREIQIPSCILDKSHQVTVEDVGVLGENLYLSVHDDLMGKLELWVMKEYGVVDSWTKLLSISGEQTDWLSSTNRLPSFFETKLLRINPLHTSKEYREILLEVMIPMDLGESIIVSYDPVSGEFHKNLNIQDVPSLFTAETYVGSLISLKSSKDMQVLND